ALLLSRGATPSTAANSLRTQYASRLETALAAFNASSSNPTAEALLRNQSQLIDRKSRVNEAVGVINQALSQTTYLRNHIDYLRDRITAFEASSITATELSVDWDNKLRKINQLASAGAKTIQDAGIYSPKNLIESQSRSSFSTQTLYAPYNSTGDTLQINGIYLGTDYYITDGDGDFWNSDTGFLGSEAAVGTLSEYTSYPGTPTGITDTVTDLVFKTFTSSSDTVTFDLSGGTPISGTITRGGLGLLDAWLYDDFSVVEDATTITRAKADLDAAESKILLAESDFRADLSVLQTRVSVFDSQIAGITTEVAGIIEKIKDEQKAELRGIQLEALVANFNFALLSARGNTLIHSLILSQDAGVAGNGIAIGEAILGSIIDLKA
ncbi:MAG: hypothetical protein HQ503_01555, partial [Rhodospirillales bacterium]|nr:hypothetical protein [Rhodospirillales bacterium]